MSDSITSTFKHSYEMSFHHLAQQKRSRLRNAVKNYSVEGDAIYVSQISATAAHEVTAAHQTTVNTDMTTVVRKIGLRRYVHSPLIDNFDLQKTIVSMESPYVQNAVMAMNRTIDDLIIQAATDVAITGRNGTGTTAIDSNMVVTASSGLTVAKLREVSKTLNEQENDPDLKRYMAISSSGLDKLLSQTEITSSDYNVVKALVQGEVNSFMGFEFIRSERLESDSGAKVYLAWCEDSLGLGIGKDINVSIDKRPDLNNDTQIFVEFFIGASRIREKGVVKINVTE